MKQNKYDEINFFSEYEKMPRIKSTSSRFTREDCTRSRLWLRLALPLCPRATGKISNRCGSIGKNASKSAGKNE